MTGINKVSCVVEIGERRRLSNLKTLMCFEDYMKAYDLLSNEILFEKIAKKGLGDKFVGSIKSLYNLPKGIVKIDGVLSVPLNSDED